MVQRLLRPNSYNDGPAFLLLSVASVIFDLHVIPPLNACEHLCKMARDISPCHSVCTHASRKCRALPMSRFFLRWHRIHGRVV
jgi:hypothetical protein